MRSVIGRYWQLFESQLLLPKESTADRRRVRLRSILIALSLIIVWVGQLVAKAGLPTLLRDHPLLLVILDARTRDIVLASPKLGVIELITVAVIWRFSVHFLYYVVGRWYGEIALRWLAGRVGKGVLRIEGNFARWSLPAVFLLSNKLVCLLAGSLGMRPAVFAAAHLPGTVIRVVVLCLVLRSNSATLVPIVSKMDQNADWLTVVFVTGTLVTLGASIYLRYRSVKRSSESDSESGTA
ncbi:SNARE-associated domain-containing protein [Nocardia suismassiliense]|uniref:hypothetical protein n=1 Tax=Nocardia suismassiliense TaxID=2077092 RepID=UPI00131F45DF|nr:hypothetical protein [Nocardia suismassiliense]